MLLLPLLLPLLPACQQHCCHSDGSYDGHAAARATIALAANALAAGVRLLAVIRFAL